MIAEEITEREGNVAHFEWNAWSYVQRRNEKTYFDFFFDT